MSFGSRVIGHKKAAEERDAVTSGAHHFGRRVIGDVVARKKELRMAREAEARGDPPPEVREAKAEKPDTPEGEIETVEAPITTNLDELEAALAGNPAFYETLFEAEKDRASGPRKQGLRLLLAHEISHDNRDERKDEIQELLKSEKK